MTTHQLYVSRDPRDPDFVQDPYLFYAEMHRSSPVFFWQDYGMWCVAGYDQVNALLRDRRLGRENRWGAPLNPVEGRGHLADFDRIESGSLLEREPPCEVRREDGRYDQACIEQPLRLTRAYIDELEAGRRRREAAALTRAFDLEADDPDAAMEAVNTVLATGVGDRYADRLVPFLERAVARREASSDHRRAAQALRKLATLTALGDPDAAQRLRARAFVHEASVPGLSSQGRQMLLSSAASLAPTDPRIAAASMGERAGLLTSAAQADPARLEARATARRQLGRGLALLLLGFGGLLAVVGAARRRRSSLAES